MDIAFYAPLKPPDHPVASGDRRMARLLIAALSAAGHHVTVASRLRTWDDGRRLGRAGRLARLGARCAARLIERRQSNPPDLWFTYHLYHKAPDWLGPAASAAFGIPYVVAEASFAPKRASGPWAEGHAAVAKALAAATAVISLTRADDACVLPLLAAPERLVELRPFLDAAPFQAAAEARADHRRRLARRHHLPARRPWLLAVGMMRAGDKQRSYRILAEALERLSALDWHLVVVGDGPCRALIEAGFGGIARDRLSFLGAVDPALLPGYYAAADLMVWPAINEAYGMALLEAQAAGVAVVAGRTGGVPDIVRDHDTGLLTPVGDAGALAEAVALLLADPARRLALGAAARATVARDHDFPHALAVLDRVVTAAGRSGSGR